MQTYSQEFDVPAAYGDFDIHMPGVKPPHAQILSESPSFPLPAGFCVSDHF